MSAYGQFCPVAKALEVLDERWTLLVVRELLMGSSHFNELRRGVPKMSPALLSKRLRSLERAGVVAREAHGNRIVYHLTPRGLELFEIVDLLGRWGLKWVQDLGEQDFDPHLLMWDMRRTVPIEKWPRERTVVAFVLTGIPSSVARWWLVVDAGESDACDFDPGFEVAVTVSASLPTLTRIWRGEDTWDRAQHRGDLSLAGVREQCRALPSWLGQSMLATRHDVAIPIAT